MIETNLSEIDKNNLNDIYLELEKLTIPTVFSNEGVIPRRFNRTGTSNQKNARQTCFGLTTYRGKKQESVSSKKHPHIMPLFEKFITSHAPEFKFNSVYVNKNTVSKIHLDSRNIEESLLVGFGKYTGGETVLFLPLGTPSIPEEKHFNISSASLIFDGSKILHGSKPFEGIRYSFVFFK